MLTVQINETDVDRLRLVALDSGLVWKIVPGLVDGTGVWSRDTAIVNLKGMGAIPSDPKNVKIITDDDGKPLYGIEVQP